MMKVLLQNSTNILECSIPEFEKKMQMRWLWSLEFQTTAINEKVLKQSKKAMKKKELNMRERWLGVFFQKEISKGNLPSVSIRWIDEHIGYGVFAEEDFSVGAFIGEYTGIVRKRMRRVDRLNDYCFEYTIGDWVHNPFIIDAKGQGNFTSYINHSDAPNLEPLSVFANNVMHIILIVLKPIKKGDQICYDYGDIFWKKRRHIKNP